jgi:aryl-alcohol dehydrogenase-like predicted oxidoreductase
MECLDLVQFHWWDFEIPGYIEAAVHLEKLRRQGKILRIGVTNFDAPRLRRLIDAGVPVTTHQLQYSLLDRRPESQMVSLCREHNIRLLCYGTVAGGFLSDRWLGREYPADELPNRSLVKYRLIIDEFGDWSAFQRLLRTLRGIADRHAVDIATVATRAVLERPMVAAAIVGATDRKHLDAHLKVSGFKLTDLDRQELQAATASSRGPGGDVYELERDRNGPHGRIMKYNLSGAREPGH